MYYISFLVQVS